MIEADKNIVFQKVFSVYVRHILKKHFHKIHLSGEENFLNRNKSLPTIVFANHSNWWDALLPFWLSYNVFNVNAFAMMDHKQLSKYKFFRWIGVFSVDKESKIDSYRAFKYAANLLKSGTNVLWIYPQGIMLPNDLRPLKFENGLSKLIKEVGDVNVIPLIYNFEFLKEQKPEVFIKILPVLNCINDNDAVSNTEYLEDYITSELDKQKQNIMNGDFSSYKIMIQGKSSAGNSLDGRRND